MCWKGVEANRKRFECERCFNLNHINCTNIFKSQQKQYTATSTYKWTCYDCTLSLLPFYKQRDVESEPSIEDDFLNTHKNNLLDNKHLLKILHLNCQSLASTFTEFEAMNYECNFDILTLSETWLTENQNLLNYVELSGYDLYYNNRENKRGGGVAAYVRESLKCKIRKDFCSLDTDIEHLWLELQGKNRHSHLLIGVFYQPNFETKSKLEWLKKFDSLVHNISRKWNGLLLITGDFNIDFLATECTITKYYNDILNSHHLFQVIAKPTRMNTSLIDHFITSTPEKIKLNDVLPCCEISDHDGPYIGINARMERYQPRFKYIRDNSKLVLEDFKADFQKLPFSTVYAMENPEDKLDIFNTLVAECINRHEPLKRIKCTRPQAP